jgi:hypothetical protein
MFLNNLKKNPINLNFILIFLKKTVTLLNQTRIWLTIVHTTQQKRPISSLTTQEKSIDDNVQDDFY